MSSTENVEKGTRVTKKGTDEYHFDLRQDVAWKLYTDQRSDTFNNAYKSAIKAGYTDLTARRITLEKWWSRKLRLLQEMLPLAEDVMMEDLKMEVKVPIIIDKEIQYKKDPQLLRIRSETAKFIGSTVGRDKYHTKTEVEANSIISLVEGNSLIDNLFKKGK